ncbi:MAG: thiamine pyrophosphate-dependent dehydrogenase E1 component subunit alpha, partial [bacterium]
AALKPDDYLWGGHRSHGHYLAKGGDTQKMMAELFGKVSGCSRGRGGSMHLVAPEVGILGTVPLVAATIPLAVGAAMAARFRKEGGVSVSFFGDGATEEGHFHESLNLAALYRLPVLFVCENNFYSSHMHISERRAKDNIFEAGVTHGIPAEQVDGNDVIAVNKAARDAVDRARAGGGPTLLECRTFRWRGHVGPAWDMDVGVKRNDDLKAWLKRDPIAIARTKLIDLGISSEQLALLDRAVQEEVDAAVDFARTSQYPLPEELMKDLFVGEGGAQ